MLDELAAEKEKVTGVITEGMRTDGSLCDCVGVTGLNEKSR